jgi:hypothetical protein
VIKTRTADLAGNAQAGFTLNQSSFTFYVDKASPTAHIEVPAHDGNYRSSQLSGLSALKGTALDAEAAYYAGDSLGPTEYKLWYLQGGASVYFDGSVFNAVNPPAWLFTTAKSSSPWKKTLDAAVWVSDKEYFIQARSTDLARGADGALYGNVQDSFPYGGPSYHRFTVDDTPPSVFVATPAAGGFVNAITRISGTANGDVGGLKPANGIKVRLYYEEGGNKYFWDWTSAFIQDSANRNRTADYTAAAGTVVWSVTSLLPSTDLLDEAKNPYYAAMDAYDLNDLMTSSTVAFRIDKASGTVVSTLPVNGSFYGGSGAPASGVAARFINAVSGTAVDTGGGTTPSGINKVEITVREGVDFYLDGGTGLFTISNQAAAWMVVSGTDNWTYPGTTGKLLPQWASGTDYTVSMKMT